MDMKKQLIIVGIIVLLVAVGLSGCTNNPLDTERNKFIGTWTRDIGYGYTVIYTYFSDGTFTDENSNGGTYDMKDGKFVMTYENGNSLVYNYSFSDNDKTLTLTKVGTSSSEVYTKQ